MKTLEIKADLRKEVGKKNSKKIRKEGNVPCVIYGGKDIIHFFAHENSFKNVVYSHNVFLVNLDIEGKKYQATMKDIQFHPVTDKILHIDFIEVSDNKPTVVEIPVELTGNSIGIKNGGKLRQRKRALKIKGLIKDIPDVLPIDITDIDIGFSFKVKDLSFNNLTLLDPPQSMVVGVVSSRIAAKGMTLDEDLVKPEGEEVEGEKVDGEKVDSEKTEGKKTEGKKTE